MRSLLCGPVVILGGIVTSPDCLTVNFIYYCSTTVVDSSATNNSCDFQLFFSDRPFQIQNPNPWDMGTNRSGA